MFSRLKVVGFIAGLAILVTPQAASGHTLGLVKASSFASYMAYQAYLRIGPATDSHGVCLQRLSAHRWDCRAWTSGHVGSTDNWFSCRQTAWVQFVSSRSYRLQWVYDPARCFGPAMRSPAEVPDVNAQARVNPSGDWQWIWNGPLTRWPTIITPTS
jgi:hypothetical protein